LAAEKGAEGAVEEVKLWEQMAAEAEAAKSSELMGTRITNSKLQQKRSFADVSSDFCKSKQSLAWLSNRNAEESRNLHNSHLCICGAG
jgi:hypothetical protein